MKHTCLTSTLLIVFITNIYGMDNRERNGTVPPPPSAEDIEMGFLEMEGQTDPHARCVEIARQMNIPPQSADSALIRLQQTDPDGYEDLMTRAQSERATRSGKTGISIKADISRAVNGLLLEQVTEQQRVDGMHVVDLGMPEAPGEAHEHIDPHELCVGFARTRRTTKDHPSDLVREALGHLQETHPGKYDRLIQRVKRPTHRGGPGAGTEDEETKKAEAAIARAITGMLTSKLGVSEQSGQLLQTQVQSLSDQVLQSSTIKKMGPIVGTVIVVLIIAAEAAMKKWNP